VKKKGKDPEKQRREQRNESRPIRPTSKQSQKCLSGGTKVNEENKNEECAQKVPEAL
jgi:hypothetical protein